MPHPASISLLESWPTGGASRAGPATNLYSFRIAAMLVGFFTPFTVSLVGEMPVGEIFLAGVLALIAARVLLLGSWPGGVFQQRWFWVLLGGQLVALAAYVMSDLYRGSTPHDMARGWGRMVFLGVDVVAMAYLFVADRVSFFFYLFAELAGEIARTIVIGALFGDTWKFGYGVPVCYIVVGGASRMGPIAAIAALGVMGLVNLAMDFRSLGATCFFVAGFTILQQLHRKIRPWVIPLLVVSLLVSALVYKGVHAGDNQRSTRSDVERSSMLIAAGEAFLASPLLGHGSWFSNTDVLENFTLIRQERARVARVGGFRDARKSVEEIAIHSQILVTLAEGGFFGACFFFVFFYLLARALFEFGFLRAWDRASPVYLLLLTSALCHLLFSPFSGAHRVYIAAACGLILMLDHEKRSSASAEEPR